MTLEISTPALLFPAVSLLFLSYTNRFLHLAALVRKLHDDWTDHGDEVLLIQIQNLRQRLNLIRWMQLFGALSLFGCVISMLGVMLEFGTLAWIAFFAAVVLMAVSLASLVIEVTISGGALKILLENVEKDAARKKH